MGKKKRRSVNVKKEDGEPLKKSSKFVTGSSLMDAFKNRVSSDDLNSTAKDTDSTVVSKLNIQLPIKIESFSQAKIKVEYDVSSQAFEPQIEQNKQLNNALPLHSDVLIEESQQEIENMPVQQEVENMPVQQNSLNSDRIASPKSSHEDCRTQLPIYQSELRISTNTESRVETLEELSNLNEQTVDLSKLFNGYCFVITTASSAFSFNESKWIRLVQHYGGCFEKDLLEISELCKKQAKIILISDAYSRTSRYMFAVAASIPCVHYNWVKECVKQKQLVDYIPYLLKAGRSIVYGNEFSLRFSSSKILKGKKFFIHSTKRGEDAKNFIELSRMYLEPLGADPLIYCEKSNITDVVEFCKNTRFDYLLLDSEFHQEVINCVKDEQTVTFSWLLDVIITGELASIKGIKSFFPHH